MIKVPSSRGGSPFCIQVLPDGNSVNISRRASTINLTKTDIAAVFEAVYQHFYKGQEETAHG